jgi:hypothetical protein
MIKILVLPADPSLPLQIADLDETDQAAAKALVGGLIEPIDLTNPAATLYVNETHKIDDLPRNPRATLLTRWHAPERRAYEVISGDAYLTGPLHHGLDTDVPAKLVWILLGAEPPLVQIRSHRTTGGWTTVPDRASTLHGEPYDTYATALIACDLPNIADVRIISAALS